MMNLAPYQRFWLLALWIGWAALLFGGFLFGRWDAAEQRRMPLWTRMFSSAALVLAAWSLFIFTRQTPLAHFSLFIALGMTLGLLGDLFMAQVLPAPNRVMAGIAAFGFGHIFYIIALLGFGNRFGLADPMARWAAWLAWMAVAVVGWYILVFRGQETSALHWAALPYALLLASTAGVATGLALQAPLLTPLALGAALFLLSDLILAGQLFSGLRFPFIGDVVWLTYGPGQMLIVFSVLLAFDLVRR
ncbi:MAG: lysoplasmalogenase [Chloroflexi bacterium]|nr:lysoplasmalogenase [Chloroflexota bacterium]